MGGGGAYSYIRIHRSSKQSISKENNAKHEYMNMSPPPLIELARPLGETQSKRLQKLQNRAARIIMNMSNDTDHSVALQALGWKTLKVERRKAKAKMMYKLLNNIGFETFQVLFVYRNRGIII